MQPRGRAPNPAKAAKVAADLMRELSARETSYRGQALKMFSHVCAHCSREFEGKRLVELTVHHKDHNHDNNPPDGSNWELLCVYCHEYEHIHHDNEAGEGAAGISKPSSTFKAFEGLADLLKKKE